MVCFHKLFVHRSPHEGANSRQIQKTDASIFYKNYFTLASALLGICLGHMQSMIQQVYIDPGRAGKLISWT